MRVRNIIIISACYIMAGLLILLLFAVTFKSINPKLISLYDIVSFGGICATFGSALLATVVIYEQKNEQQIKENVGILFEKIFEQEKWTRWSFLDRRYVLRCLDGTTTISKLTFLAP